MRAAVLLGLALSMAFPALAQDAVPSLPGKLAGLVGPWSLESADASFHCVVMLLPDAEAKGYALSIADSCGKAAPVANVSTWSLDPEGAMIFSDSEGKPVLQLSPMGKGGTFASPPGSSLQYTLVALTQPEGDE